MPSDDHSIQVPKKKRSREQLDVNPPNESEAASESVQKPVQAEPDEKNSTDVKEPEKKRHRDSSQEHETKSDKVGSACFFSHLLFSLFNMIALGFRGECICEVFTCCVCRFRQVPIRLHWSIVPICLQACRLRVIKFRFCIWEFRLWCPWKWILWCWRRILSGGEDRWPHQLRVTQHPRYFR